LSRLPLPKGRNSSAATCEKLANLNYRSQVSRDRRIIGFEERGLLSVQFHCRTPHSPYEERQGNDQGTDDVEPNPDAQTQDVQSDPDAQTQDVQSDPDAQTQDVQPDPDAQTQDVQSDPDAQTQDVVEDPDLSQGDADADVDEPDVGPPHTCSKV
jgi:hypothetical protein